MIYCDVCIAKHGPGCIATHSNGDGRPVCVFCLDGVLCPAMKRFLFLQEERSMGKEDKRVNGTDAASNRVNDSQAAGATPTATLSGQKCEVAECKEILGPQNKSGFCRRHFHRSESKSSGANGHPSARTNVRSTSSKARSNGHPQYAGVRANGHAKNGFHKNGTNGHSIATIAEILKPAGTGEQLTEERVNSVLLGLPLVTKRKFLTAWLDGAI